MVRASSPDLATASRFGHRLEALVAPRPVPRGGTTSAPIQRALTTDHLGDLPEALRDQLRPQIEAFNDHVGAAPQEGHEQEHRNRQFEMLHGIDQRINSHLRDNPTTGDDARKALFSVLRESEDHHIAATRQAIQGGDQLWLPNTVDQGDAKQARRRWDRIRTGSGNVHIQGDDDFRTETLSSLAKLLQGDHGRRLLNTLDADQEDRRKRIWIQRGASSAAVPHNLEHATQVRGRRGAGTGSTVSIAARANAPASLDDYGSGEHGEAILAPRFLTLGHELGHARHNLAGTTGDIMWHNDPTDAVQDPIEKALWTDPEEHQNITTEENPIRAEHQMPSRQYHAKRGTGRRTRNQMELTRRLDALMDTIPPDHRDALGPHIGAIHADMIAPATDLSNPEHARALHARINQEEWTMPARIRMEQAKALANRFGDKVKSWF